MYLLSLKAGTLLPSVIAWLFSYVSISLPEAELWKYKNKDLLDGQSLFMRGSQEGRIKA